MAIVELLMPKMGESIMEATILRWLKKPGDKVMQDESLLEIATDKVDTEVPSTAAGILTETLFSENAVVPVGAVIAKIQTESYGTVAEKQITPDPEIPSEYNNESADADQATNGQPTYIKATAADAINGQTTYAKAPVGDTANGQRPTANENRFYSPLVLNIASNEGINMLELEKIPGSGNEGRVTKKDILQYVSKRKTGNRFYSEPVEEKSAFTYSRENDQFPHTEYIKDQQEPIQDANISGNVEIQEMDRMRKLIAEHMVRSKQTSPHVTSFSEADVTNLANWREKEKDAFEKREGTKLTLTPLFIEAVIKCIKKYPLINSSVQGDKIVIKKDIHIGMATALPSGSLIVPVIKYADNYNRVGLARQVNTLANNARNNKLKPEDIQDGTFTLTNVGVFGSLMGTPIINQPQVAILAVGAIKKRPVVIETEQGDAIGIRHMMYLSMSYDHRIIDGSLGASFLSEVAKELENFQP
jgi:2-oxoglutarate dehydrogenase E2 component (dihydrolipoamide succinyltransferase)